MVHDDNNYWSDHRVRAGQRKKMELDEKKGTMELVLYNDEGDEETFDVPFKFEVCPTCEGRGKHVNPSIDSNGLTAEDFHEDPDLAESYFNGLYDVECYGCDGKRVVPVVDEDKADAEILKRWRKQLDADAEYARIQAAERRYGC